MAEHDDSREGEEEEGGREEEDAEKAGEEIRIGGEVRVWSIREEHPARGYVVLNLAFATARAIFRPRPWSYRTDEGEQRSISPSHVRTIRKEMEEGRFTPACVHVGLRRSQKTRLEYADKKDHEPREVFLTLRPGETLPLLNGGHRFEALERLRKAAEEKSSPPAGGTPGRPAGVKARERASATIRAIDSLPITAIWLVEGGRNREDFLNLQKGKAVDPSHILALRIACGIVGKGLDRASRFAWDIGRILNSTAGSPFHKYVRFDSGGAAILPFNSLCATGPADAVGSLVGLGRVAEHHGRSREEAAFLAISAFDVLKKKAPDLLESGRLLTPPPEGGRGSACILLGVGVLLAWRMIATRKEGTVPDETTLARVVRSARRTLGGRAEKGGVVTGPTKRRLFGAFARDFLADMIEDDAPAPEPAHDGLPARLFEVFVPSALAAAPLPKKKKTETRITRKNKG